MRKKIRFFRQHTMRTCGAACMLMLLDLYEKVQYPTPKQEMKLYSLYHSHAFLGMLGAAIADCLSRNDLDVRLMHSSCQMMDNRDGYFQEELFGELLAEYQASAARCADRIRLTTGMEITTDTLKRELAEGRQLMVQCIVPGDADGIHDHVLHWIVVYGYEDGNFLVCDPLSSKITLTEEALAGFMDTPIGHICIAIGEKT